MSLQRGYENINDKRKDAEKEIGKKNETGKVKKGL